MSPASALSRRFITVAAVDASSLMCPPLWLSTRNYTFGSVGPVTTTAQREVMAITMESKDSQSSRRAGITAISERKLVKRPATFSLAVSNVISTPLEEGLGECGSLVERFQTITASKCFIPVQPLSVSARLPH